MPEDDRDRYCCSGCPSLGGPSGIGGSFYCESGDDQIDLATHDGRPLRSAKCVAANQPLLTRDEFLAAVRAECEDDELVLPSRALADIRRIWIHHDRSSGGLFIRTSDALAYIPTRLSPMGCSIAFIGCATWGEGAVHGASVSLAVARKEVEYLERLLAGLGEPGPAQTD